MKEYIVPIADNERDYDEMFIGTIRKREELVRCRECIHHDVFGRTTKYYGCKFYGIAVDADHFCKKGERSADDE